MKKSFDSSFCSLAAVRDMLSLSQTELKVKNLNHQCDYESFTVLTYFIKSHSGPKPAVWLDPGFSKLKASTSDVAPRVHLSV